MRYKIPILFSLILVAGCIDTTQPIIGTPNVQINDPYSINPSLLGIMIDTNISVPITNTRNEEIGIDILESSITINNKDGTKLIIYGDGNRISISPRQTQNLIIEFKGISAKYQLVENPLRLVPLTNSYEVKVRYKATTNIFFGLLPYTKEDVYTQTILAKEIPISDEVFKGII